MGGLLPEGWMDALPRYEAGVGNMASRKYSQHCIDALAPLLPEMMGGSADLTPSNLTNFKGCIDFQAETPAGRYLRFGVREHGMAAICNGLAAHGGVLPYCATFLNFVGYALGAMRVTSLSHFRVIYVMTHDSIGLGEDGPTHQVCLYIYILFLPFFKFLFLFLLCLFVSLTLFLVSSFFFLLHFHNSLVH